MTRGRGTAGRPARPPRWLISLTLLPLVSCGVGSDGDGALHHPDLRLAALATEAEGSGDLFTSYHAGGPVRWNQEWPWKLDLTGIAWDRANTATAITPRHVVMAAHFTRKVGQDLVFHDRSGRRHVRTVRQIVTLTERGLPCDVAIGLLDLSLPAAVRRYPLPEVTGSTDLTGTTVLVTEQKRRLYFHRIASHRERWLRMRFAPDFPDSRRKRLIQGDSGHPAFLLSKGELVLVSTHTGGGPGSGPWYGSPEIREKLREIVRELDPDFDIRTVGIDRPTLADARQAREASPPAASPKPQARESPPTVPPAQPGRPRPRVVRPPGS